VVVVELYSLFVRLIGVDFWRQEIPTLDHGVDLEWGTFRQISKHKGCATETVLGGQNAGQENPRSS
jgi:hypothetical protein